MRAVEHTNKAGDEIIRRLLAYRSRLLGFLRKRLSDADTAEDILQHSLLKALRAAPEIEEDERLLAWFTRVLRNAVIDHYRAAGSETRRIESLAASLDRPMGQEEERELCACLQELLPDMTPAYREVIELMDLGGLPQTETARRLGIETNNLKVRHHRARKQLREKLEENCRLCAKHGCLDCTCTPAAGSAPKA